MDVIGNYDSDDEVIKPKEAGKWKQIVEKNFLSSQKGIITIEYHLFINCNNKCR